MRNVLDRFAAAPPGMKVLLAVVALVVLGLLVLLSPFVVVLATLVLIVVVFALLVSALRRKPLGRRWGVVAATSLLFVLVFSGVSNALYGGGQEQSASREPAKAESDFVAEPRTTATPAETGRGEKSSGQDEAESEPEPKPKPQPDPQPDAEAVVGPKTEQEQRDRFDAAATVTEVVDGDTINISPAINGNDEVRLIGVDTPETKTPARR